MHPSAADVGVQCKGAAGWSECAVVRTPMPSVCVCACVSQSVSMHHRSTLIPVWLYVTVSEHIHATLAAAADVSVRWCSHLPQRVQAIYFTADVSVR